MKIFSKEVFEEVKNPIDKESFRLLQKMPKAEQLKWLNNYKEYELEKKIYDKVVNEGKTVEDVFCYDQDIDEAKRVLAFVRLAMLKEIRKSDREYSMEFSRHSYAFDCAKTEDVKTRFDIYRRVKTFSIKNYLPSKEQTIGYCWF